MKALVTTVSSVSALTSSSFTCRVANESETCVALFASRRTGESACWVMWASGVIKNRVPIQTPAAPIESAAASPLPSKIPPAATTGTRPATASTTWGTSTVVATEPVWPPASPPWAMMKSTPASNALTACFFFPAMLPTRIPLLWNFSTVAGAG